jgi:nitroimidazol reductase NimA-like FMN-containing flavoprotein (pyridoxamine 5'-phosphate oxidase superfamily)
MSKEIAPTESTRLKRLPKRGSFDRETINGILDEGLVCHVGFTVGGRSIVIPTGYARALDKLLIHGSSASRMMRSLAAGIDVCVTVSIIDGLVLARSAFHHSVNYRSVMIFGTAVVTSDRDEKIEALRLFTEHMVPGRWNDVRWPNDLELKATTVLSLPIDEASAKVRTGGPVDDDKDYELDVWAGVIPVQLLAGDPIPDERIKTEVGVPEYAVSYRRY